ncbi:MAG TPA: hypothetical protein DCF33_07065, partial [Saprospirales bacterium]|nr:hypothetical protein [Saprospirales bacterium]
MNNLNAIRLPKKFPDWIRFMLSAGWLVFYATLSQGQTQDSLSKSPAPRDYKRLDIFPAISYSPETKLTLGAIGIYYLDLRKGDRNTPLSNIDFLAVYTLNKQILLESRWEVFTH